MTGNFRMIPSRDLRSHGVKRQASTRESFQFVIRGSHNVCNPVAHGPQSANKTSEIIFVLSLQLKSSVPYPIVVPDEYLMDTSQDA